MKNKQSLGKIRVANSELIGNILGDTSDFVTRTFNINAGK